MAIIHILTGAYSVTVIVSGLDGRVIQSIESSIRSEADRVGGWIPDDENPYPCPVEIPDDHEYMGFEAFEDDHFMPELVSAIYTEARAWSSYASIPEA